MKVYISGKKSEETINYLISKGYEVINLQNDAFRSLNILHILGCDAIYLGRGWENECSSIIDKEIAEMAGKEILYQEDGTLPQIKAAIYSATGVAYDSISSQSRKKWVVYAKVIFVKLAHECGASIDEIAALINRSPRNVFYSLKKYKEDMRFTPEFKQLSDKVRLRLSKN